MRGAWCSMRGGRSRWPAGRAVEAGGALSWQRRGRRAVVHAVAARAQAADAAWAEKIMRHHQRPLAFRIYSARRGARSRAAGDCTKGRGANARAPRARVRADAATHSRHPTLDAVRLRVPAPVRVQVDRLPHLHGAGVDGTPLVSHAAGLPQDSGVLSIQLLLTGSSQSRASLPQVSNARGRLR